MHRRSFLTLLGTSATAWPLAARAQQQAMPVVGFLNSGSAERFEHLTAAFRRGLGETGYIEGQNVSIEYRWAQEQNDRLRDLADDLVRRGVAVIVATSNATVALAAKASTTTIPIIFELGVDPVELGLVASLNRPGGNLTGVTSLNVELGPKRLELIRGILPSNAVVALLINSTNPNADILTRDAVAAARTLGLQLHVVQASSEAEFDDAFTTAAQARAGALVIGPDSLFNRVAGSAVAK